MSQPASRRWRRREASRCPRLSARRSARTLAAASTTKGGTGSRTSLSRSTPIACGPKAKRSGPARTRQGEVPNKLALGDRVLDLRRRALLDARGAPVDLRPQVWAVLEHLARNAGRVVAKEELLDAVWPGVVVTDGSVMQAISDVRAALGDTEHRIVKTMQRRGYMLLADALDDDAESTRSADRRRDARGCEASPLGPRSSHAMQASAEPAQRHPESLGESRRAMPRQWRFACAATRRRRRARRRGLVEVWPQQRRLRIDGSDTTLGGRAFDLLLALIERRDRVVNRSELFDLVWPGRVVEDNNLARAGAGAAQAAGRRTRSRPCPGVATGSRWWRTAKASRLAHEPAAAPAPSAADAMPEPFALPAAPALLGRDDDLAALQHLLAQHRHVSVLGAGGIGKTVLALAAAQARRSAHRDGAAWVDLSSLSRPALVAVAVAQALRLPVSRGEQPIPALIAGMKSLDVAAAARQRRAPRR